MKKFILIFFLIIFLIEILSRSFSSFLLPDQTVFAFPNTKIRNKILIDRKLIIDPNNIKYIKPKFEGRPIPLINQIQKNIPHKLDKDSGAVDNYFYKDGFCNKSEVKNSKSIISIGDSFTYCTSVEPDNAWIKKINLNDKYELINYGVPGVGLYEYLEILNSKITSNVEIIIVAIYEGNDLRDAISHKKFVQNENFRKKFYDNLPTKKFSLRDSNDNAFTYYTKRYLGNFYSFNLIFSFLKQINQIIQNKKVEDFRYYISNKDEKIIFNVSNLDRDELINAKKIYFNEIQSDEIFDLFETPILRMKLIAKKNNSKIFFVYLPAAYSVLESKNRELTFFNPENKKIMYNFSKVQQKIFHQICEKHMLNCINVTKKLKKANINIKMLTHFKSNNHLTAYGHKIVSEEISLMLREKIN